MFRRLEMADETSRIYFLYRIVNKINGKVYIGQALDVPKRWYDHRKAFKANRPTQIIHHALIKYGLDNFEFEIIASCKTQDDTNNTETELVKQYDSFIGNGGGYNATLGGMNAPKTEEWKQKISQILMGHEVSQEARDKISQGNTGKVRSDEFKKNVSAFHAGKEVSEKTRQLLSEINTGKEMLKETRQKLSEINKGKKLPEETKKKIGNAIRGTTTVHRRQTWKVIDGKRVWVKVLLPDQKECSKCHEIKNILDFSKRTDGGLASWCKKCFNKYRRERRRVNL